jgi:hypothetical protein
MVTEDVLHCRLFTALNSLFNNDMLNTSYNYNYLNYGCANKTFPCVLTPTDSSLDSLCLEAS